MLRLSSQKEEGQQRLSKWLKHAALLDEEEMTALFEELGPFQIFNVSVPVVAEKMEIARADFLRVYAHYVQALKVGRMPDEKEFKPYFSSIFTTETRILYAMPVANERFLIKAIKPVVQLQAHHFYYSDVDGKFHPMVLSDGSITWGIQFSYPQIYQSPNDSDFSRVNDSFPNTALFQKIARWMRHHTVPTPFLVGEKQTNVPFRIGKKCFSWIDRHPGLNSIRVKL